MPKPKVLSGKDIVRIFELFDFIVFDQRGSHIKIRRVLKDGSRQTLTVPNHKELDRGTLVSLFKQGGRHISQVELHPYFYAE